MPCNHGEKRRELSGIYLRESSCEKDCEKKGFPEYYNSGLSCTCLCEINPVLAVLEAEKCICKTERCGSDTECCSGNCIPYIAQCTPVFGDKCDACKRRCEAQAVVEGKTIEDQRRSWGSCRSTIRISNYLKIINKLITFQNSDKFIFWLIKHFLNEF